MDISKTRFLNGIKGIACILVFFHHFLLSFYPAVHFGINSISHMPYCLDVKLSQHPISVFFNGNFMVCIFLLISSFIFTNKFLTNDNVDAVAKTIIKRYLKIVLPVFIISIVILGLNWFDLFKNNEVSLITGSSWLNLFYQTKLSIIDLLICSVSKVPFFGNDTFCTVFWMLKYIVVGSFLSILLGLICNVLKQKSLCFMIFISIIVAFGNTYYFPIVLGSLLSVIIKNMKQNQMLLGISFLVVGLFLGGYPSGVVPTNIYKYFNILSYFNIKEIEFCHSVGAFLLLLGIWQLNSIKKILNNKFFGFLGSISFSVYLTHILILFCFSTRVFRKLYIFTSFYTISTFITFIITLIVVIVISILFNLLISRKINILIDKIVNYLICKE